MQLELDLLLKSKDDADLTIHELSSDIEKTSESIKQSISQVKELTVFDPEDLALLRQEFSFLLLTHLWRPLSFTNDSQIWIYDGAIKVRIFGTADERHMNVSLANDARVT